ncbi:hypothetical protein CHS0354_034248 [Potamilus streckersoni]|uniref:Uncharacterized protein n=1 Tax=Potamilus streckersoni TaxID=2493646 RepID=A0AAE0SEP5_9BIVA|nr:hypothetical protein CHS0354_034248 [Potamilus streckersoni]
MPGAWYVNITWTPSMSDVNTRNILCFTATDNMSLTSQQRCIDLFVIPEIVINGSERIQFEYGPNNSDISIEDIKGKCVLAYQDYKFPLFNSTYSKIYVCITGIVTFDQPFESPGTVKGSDMKGRTILAPYFTDIYMIDLNSEGRVYYQTHNSINGDINKFSNVMKAQEIIRRIHGDVGNFSAKFALFVTWLKALPSAKLNRLSQSMTFQLGLVTDGDHTFAFYVFPQDRINLNSQPVYIGFTTKDGQNYKDYRSFTSDVYQIDKSAMSFGYKGLLHYRLSFPSSGKKSLRQVCIDWYLTERNNQNEYNEGLKKMPLCPCDTSYLVRDQFYSDNNDFEQGNASCTYIRPNWQFLPTDSGKTCCYDKTNKYFIAYGADAGGFIRYHPDRQKLMHTIYDRNMKTACCEENDTCSLYQSVRPIGRCYTIFPAWHAPARGDPHFMTLDGQNFTFNGWGEFTMVNINSSTEVFELQARTSRLVTKDGNMSDATAFSAFAARDKNNINVHVELDATKTGLIIYARMDPGLMLSDYTLEFMDMEKEFNFASSYLALSRSNQTKDVMVVFSSGIAFTVGVSVNMLNIDVLIPNKFNNMTAGLLGNFDGDPTNDFQFRNGTVLSGIIREKDIFEFGKNWAVHPNQSAFWYPRGKGYYDYSHLNYTPIFLEDLDAEKVVSASKICGEEGYECIFDLVLTEDEEVGKETRRLVNVSRQLDEVLANEAPRISGPTTINVTINETASYQVNASDDGTFTYRLLDGQMYANITDQKNGTALVTLLLQDDRPINVKATVVDKFGVLATPQQLVIVFCSTCNQRGTCNFEEFRDDYRTTDTYRYAICRCEPAWDGPDCELDRNGCATQPCSPLRNCIDIPAPIHKILGVGYNCSNCPAGFNSTDDGGCEDIDECSSSNGGCSHMCNNSYGTFVCSCFEGYRKSTGSNTCLDINECSEASNDCDQICSNYIGGYNCSCYEGFIFNSVTRSCEKGTIPSECNSLNCSGTAGCTKDEHGNATCFCKIGFQMSPNGDICNDVDECQRAVCQHRCINTEGSFSCSCFNGYIIESDRSSCKICELPKYGENCNNTCQCGQGAIECDHTKGCICSKTWTGTNCDEDIDECLVPNICNDSFKICLNTNGSYRCNCKDGYTLNASGSCIDLNECNHPELNTCQQLCNNEAGGFSCSCFNGYIQDRNDTTHCEDIDECSVGISRCEQLCQNSNGRYTCDCYFGYILNSDRKTCKKVEDPCATFGNITCSQLCVLEDGHVFCSCGTGYKLGSDNQTCEDINECEDKTLNRCSDNCTNVNASYVCSCPNGFHLANDGRTCRACDAFHYGPNCSTQCNCGIGSERCDPILGCVCYDGWHGTNCDKDIDECVKDPCSGTNSICINTAGSYACNCFLGYRNVSGICEDIDECSDPRLNECNHICKNNIGSYNCSCYEGFVSNGIVCIAACKANTYGPDCDLNCTCDMENTQLCSRVDGTCLCRKGWEGKECRVDIDECSGSSSPCGTTNKMCVNSPGSFACKCEQGYEMSNTTQCIDLDECAGLHNCSHQCINSEGSYRCTCNEGFQLSQADNRSCFDLDECAGLHNCSYQCINSEGSYRCTCKEGFQLSQADNRSCFDIDECTGLHNCSHQCVNSEGGYRCTCNEGFYLSQADNHSCLSCGPNNYGIDCAMNCTCNMQNTQACDARKGTCFCQAGWKGIECNEDVDECSNSSNPCGAPNMFCVNGPGSFSCKCEPGYISNNAQCTACRNNTFGMNCSFYCSCNISNSINNNQTCDPYNGTCLCKEGWMGVDCIQDINECELDPAVCEKTNNSGCYNTYGSFRCVCYIGYISDVTGRCIKDVSKTTTPVSVDNTHMSFECSITLEFILDQSNDIRVPQNYAQIESDVQNALSEFYRTKMDQLFVRIVIISIRRGSLISEYRVITRKSEDALLKLANANAGLATGEKISLAGQNSSVLRLNVEGHDLPNDTLADQLLCKSYQLLKGVCTKGYECVLIDSQPTCMPRKKEDNSLLILAVGIGASFSAIFSLVIVSLVVIYKCKSQTDKRSKVSSSRRKVHTFRNVAYNNGIYN